MKFKTTKETEDFIYYENEYGVGAVASKKAHWIFDDGIPRIVIVDNDVEIVEKKVLQIEVTI